MSIIPMSFDQMGASREALVYFRVHSQSGLFDTSEEHYRTLVDDSRKFLLAWQGEDGERTF